MYALALLMLLSARPPGFDLQYLDKCMDGEDASTCQRRQERWRGSLESYKQEVAEERKRELEYLKKDAASVTVAAEPGRATVGPLAPTWCKGSTDEPEGDLSLLRNVGRQLTTFADQRYFSFQPLLRSAGAMCLAPDNDDVKKLAGALVQSMVNLVGYSQEEAVADLTARMDADGLMKAKKALCDELTVSDEAEGSAKAMANARFGLFGCQKADSPDTMLWVDPDVVDASAALYYLDSGLTPDQETLRLAWLLVVTRNTDTLPTEPFRAINHAMVQVDLSAFDAKRAAAELSEAPFAGNAWATIVRSESLARYAVQKKEYEDAIAKLTKKDEGWKDIIVTAPKKAVAEWEAQTRKFSAAMERSRDFERKAFGTSRKAAKGCSKALRGDFSAFLKSVKAAPTDFSAAVLSDAVGSLLLQRLAVCEAAEGNGKFAGLLRSSWLQGRVLRGPRFSALYAAIEALSEVRKDRPKFPLDPTYIRPPQNSDLFSRFEDGFDSVSVPGAWDKSNGSTVQTVKKQGATVKVVFITKKHQEPEVECTNTHRIFRIEPNGVVTYYQNCRDTGRMVTVTQHMPDALIPADLADGIKPGAWLEVARTEAVGPAALPVAAYSDGKKKKLLSWRGFKL